MGLLDGLTAFTFHSDDTGHTVFFPHGVAGAGYVVDTAAREQKIRRFVTAYTVIAVAVGGVTGSIAVRAGWPGLAALGLILVALLGVYEVEVRRLVAGLDRSTARRSLLEGYRQQAHLMGRRTVMALEAGSIAFVAMGVVMICWSAESSMAIAASGVAAAAFFGVCAIVFAVELRALGVPRLGIAGLDIVVASAAVVTLLTVPAMARPAAPGGEEAQALRPPGATFALPSFMAGGYPHEDPALEDLMPQSAGGLQLWVWSVRGEHVLAARGDDAGVLTAVLRRLGRTTADLSAAVAGRSVVTDPPNWTFAYRIKGLSGSAVRDSFRAINPAPSPCPLCETRTIDGKSVLVIRDTTSESVAMEYATPDAFVMVLAPKEAAALDMVRQTAAEPTTFANARGGFTISIPSSWIVVTRVTAADPAAITALKAHYPKYADGIDALVTWVGKDPVELGAVRATTELPPPVFSVDVVGNLPNATERVTIEALLASVRGNYELDAGAESRSVTIAGRPAWEVRWTGRPIAQPGSGGEWLAYFFASGDKVYEVLFATVPGRMSGYADAFQKIVASLELTPPT